MPKKYHLKFFALRTRNGRFERILTKKRSQDLRWAPPNAPLTQNYHHYFEYVSKINIYLHYVKETILEPLPKTTFN